MTKGTILSEEQLKRIAENNHKFDRLVQSMDENFNDIFEVAPDHANYAVGLYEEINGKEKLRLHYFANKFTPKNIFEPIVKLFRTHSPEGVLDFMIKKQGQGMTISNFIYRNQKDIVLMF